MTHLNLVFLKAVRWSGWFLLPLTLAFLTTGYAISGQYGFGALMSAEAAVAAHRLLHGPLLLLLLVHLVPAVYLALQRWGWIKPRPDHEPRSSNRP